MNLYSANTESEQVEVINRLIFVLKELAINQEKKNAVLARDFNFFTNTKLEVMGGRPALKKKVVAKLIQIKECFEFCNIWRIRNPSTQRYTSSKKYF